MESKNKKYFITSALPFSNNIPHLGNLIGSTLSGDILARFKRQQGFEVIYLCGTDEYGSTTTIKAKKEGLTCQELCDKYHKLHKEIYDWFNIKFDVWGRTPSQSQTMITHEIFLALYKNGYIESKTSVQLYCEKCKMFLADRYVKGTCYHEECGGKKSIANGDQCDICQKMIDICKLIDPFCSTCFSRPVQKESEHLYLKLGELEKKLEENLNKNNFKPNVLSIAKAWLKTGLTSRCITRDLTWGTSIPKGVDSFLDRFVDKVFYVWFDAPFGYYSILAEKKSDWREWLTSPDIEWISTQAKDNIPFHTIVFPASIIGSGLNYPLINQICGTDYLLYEGQKFSKSNGIGLFGDQVIQISKTLEINEDYWRFYLVKIRPETQDSNFSIKEFVQTINTDLVNNIGNFINRCVSLTINYTGNQKTYEDKSNTEFVTLAEYVNKYTSLMDDFKFRDALKLCLELASYGNSYLQKKQPWALMKNQTNQALYTIYTADVICWVLLQLLLPFIPNTCERLLEYFGADVKYVYQWNFEKYIEFDFGERYALPFKKIELGGIEKLI